LIAVGHCRDQARLTGESPFPTTSLEAGKLAV
jgi:hypothetical protein